MLGWCDTGEKAERMELELVVKVKYVGKSIERERRKERKCKGMDGEFSLLSLVHFIFHSFPFGSSSNSSNAHLSSLLSS